MDEYQQRFAKFIDLLEKRAIVPIENTEVKESCTATLLLIFVVVDALSKITCCDQIYKSSNSGKRFKYFLSEVLKNRYSTYKNAIYNLRNNIVHTGLNTKVILSKDTNTQKHLIVDNGNLWINSNQFLIDIKSAIDRIKINVTARGTYYINVKKRIKRFNLIQIDNEDDLATPSPGPDEETFS